MSMNYETLDLHELLHYGELGEVPGIHPTIAKSIREKLEAGANIKDAGPSKGDLEDRISALEEKLEDIKNVVDS
jgi:hypothetical protein